MFLNVKFWRWVKKYVEGKIRDLSGVSPKCPNCKLWAYQKDQPDIWVLSQYENVEICHCSQCGHNEYWRFDLLPFRLGVRCTEQGGISSYKEDLFQ